MKATCRMCGCPAESIDVAWGTIIACPCVPRDRFYVLPEGVGHATPIMAMPHIPSGIVMVKVGVE